MTQDIAASPKREVSESHRLIVALALAPCYFVHLLPFDIFVFFQPIHPLWILAGVALLIAGRVALPRFAPRAYRLGGLLYYAVVAANLLFFGYFVWLLDRSFLLVWALTVAALGGLLFAFGERRRWPSLFYLAAAYPFVVKDRSYLVIALTLLAIALTAPAFLRLSPKRIGRTALLAAGAVALLLARIELFYYHGDPSLLGEIKKQDRVTAILTPDQRGSRQAWSLIGKQIRFAAEDFGGARVLIGGSSRLVAIDRNGSSPQVVFTGTTGDGLAYAPAARRLLVGDYARRRLVWLNGDDLAIAAATPSLDRAFTNVWLDETADIALTGDDFTRDIGVFSAGGEGAGRFLDSRASRDAVRDETTGDLIAATLRRVRWIDPATGATKRELAVPSFQIRLEIDAPRRRLYVSAFSTGEIWRVNLDNGRIEQKLELEPGIRFLRLTPDKNTLFAANYLNGRIHQLAAPELKIERTIAAGPRVRSLHIAPGSPYLVFGSSLGAFRYRYAD
ncbi:MAG: hypothetical protein GX444_19130 [Myxococcales bacterium]|nr:hypothetical protein [Myxococcales bacterium]